MGMIFSRPRGLSVAESAEVPFRIKSPQVVKIVSAPTEALSRDRFVGTYFLNKRRSLEKKAELPMASDKTWHNTDDSFFRFTPETGAIIVYKPSPWRHLELREFSGMESLSVEHAHGKPEDGPKVTLHPLELDSPHLYATGINTVTAHSGSSETVDKAVLADPQNSESDFSHLPEPAPVSQTNKIRRSNTQNAGHAKFVIVGSSAVAISAIIAYLVVSENAEEITSVKGVASARLAKSEQIRRLNTVHHALDPLQNDGLLQAE